MNITQDSSLVASRPSGHEFLQAKGKVHKSYIYDIVNSETIIVDGKLR